MKTMLQKELKKEINNSLFSGAAIGIYSHNNDRRIEIYQGEVKNESKESITESTFFDLASLTKAMVTALLTMTFSRQGLLLTTPISEIYGDKIGIGGKTTISDLLLHKSGLIDHRKFYEKCEGNCKDFIIDQIVHEKPVYERGKKQIYSDLGYILLGDILEKYSDQRLDLLWRERIAIPLGIEDEFFFSSEPEESTKSCAYTTSLVDNSVSYCGQVHDDNCRVMGGIAGHAGLFGTIKGSLKLYISLLNCFLGKGDLPFIDQDVLKTFWQKPPQSRWAFGFDTPSELFSTSGKHFSTATVGHLGFTGTSFWIDPFQEVVVAVFTNRAVYSDNLRKMKIFRPRIHNLIMEGLQSI